MFPKILVTRTLPNCSSPSVPRRAHSGRSWHLACAHFHIPQEAQPFTHFALAGWLCCTVAMEANSQAASLLCVHCAEAVKQNARTLPHGRAGGRLHAWTASMQPSNSTAEYGMALMCFKRKRDVWLNSGNWRGEGSVTFSQGHFPFK